MNVAGDKLDSDERVSPAAFGLAFAALVVLAGLLVWRFGKPPNWTLIFCTMSPGFAAAGCTAALYYEHNNASLTRLASSVLFLEALMICLPQVNFWESVLCV